jgi:hypothetical protein
MAWNSCHKCKCKMWIDDALNEAALNARGKISFYCSYGHSQIYSEGENEETLLRRERDILKQQAARLEELATQERARADTATEALAKSKAKTRRMAKRASAGTCPCCARTFSNMAEHMKHQHPEFVKEGGANVVRLKTSVKTSDR